MCDDGVYGRSERHCVDHTILKKETMGVACMCEFLFKKG